MPFDWEQAAKTLAISTSGLPEAFKQGQDIKDRRRQIAIQESQDELSWKRFFSDKDFAERQLEFNKEEVNRRFGLDQQQYKEAVRQFDKEFAHKEKVTDIEWDKFLKHYNLSVEDLDFRKGQFKEEVKFKRQGQMIDLFTNVLSAEVNKMPLGLQQEDTPQFDYNALLGKTLDMFELLGAEGEEEKPSFKGDIEFDEMILKSYESAKNLGYSIEDMLKALEDDPGLSPMIKPYYEEQVYKAFEITKQEYEESIKIKEEKRAKTKSEEMTQPGKTLRKSFGRWY